MGEDHVQIATHNGVITTRLFCGNPALPYGMN